MSLYYKNHKNLNPVNYRLGIKCRLTKINPEIRWWMLLFIDIIYQQKCL